jgi:NtrC-family two-component system sensor histidine kinase KinB
MKGPAAEKEDFYNRVLEPEYQEIKSLAWQIADVNLANFSRYRGRGSQLAANANRWMSFLLLMGMLLSVVAMIVLGRAVLKPIQQLMLSAREIEKGNLDLTLEVQSADELGQLAEAFNSMAGHLREFRRSDQAKLLRTQKTTQMAINSFSDPVAVLSASGEMELCNRAAENLFGLRSGHYLSQSSLKHLEKYVPRVLESGQAYEPRGYNEAIQIFQDGREKFVLPRLLPVLDEKDRVVGVTLVLVDVTGLRKMDEMKTDLLSTVSHELKTPLTSVRMITHLLLEKSLGPLTEKQEEMLNTARDDSNRLHNILEDLLDLGRLQAGKDILQLRPQAAGRLIEDAVELLKVELKDKNLRLEMVVEPALQEVAIDPQRIGHVFSNLFGNAIKYSPVGGVIRIGARMKEGNVCFWIQDSGPGISEAYKTRIFERFFRVPDQTVVQGAGLGLAIAKEIVEMHGGQIMVESQAGRGAIFSFELPLWTVDQKNSRRSIAA